MYGLSVAGNMVGTSVLLMLVMHYNWHTHPSKIALYACTALVVDLLLFAGCLSKLVSLGWVTLLLGFFFASLMMIWYDCNKIVHKKAERPRVSLKDVDLTSYDRGKFVGVFLQSNPTQDVPDVMHDIMSRMLIMPRLIFVMHVKYMDVPFVGEFERLQYSRISEQIHHITVVLGFADPKPSLHALYHRAITDFMDGSVSHNSLVTFFTENSVVMTKRSLSIWQRLVFRVFLTMKANETPTPVFYLIPHNETVQVGQVVIVDTWD